MLGDQFEAGHFLFDFQRTQFDSGQSHFDPEQAQIDFEWIVFDLTIVLGCGLFGSLMILITIIPVLIRIDSSQPNLIPCQLNSILSWSN